MLTYLCALVRGIKTKSTHRVDRTHVSAGREEPRTVERRHTLLSWMMHPAARSSRIAPAMLGFLTFLTKTEVKTVQAEQTFLGRENGQNPVSGR
jgi:hypothetical protein